MERGDELQLVGRANGTTRRGRVGRRRNRTWSRAENRPRTRSRKGTGDRKAEGGRDGHREDNGGVQNFFSSSLAEASMLLDSMPTLDSFSRSTEAAGAVGRGKMVQKRT